MIIASTQAAPLESPPSPLLQSIDDAIRTSILNVTAEAFEPPWVPGPSQRGTLSLVFSCALTLFLCVWTTVHVNIEPEGNYNNTLFRLFPGWGRRSGGAPTKSSRAVGYLLANKTVRKLGWGFVTLIVPEGAMTIAAYERRTAHRLRNEVRKIEGYEYFDLLLAYYSIMGGFVIQSAGMIMEHGEGKVSMAGEKDVGIEDGEAIRETIPALMSNEEEKTTQAVSSVSENKELHPSKLNPPRDGHDNLQSTANFIPLNEPLTFTPHGVLQLARWDKLPPITSAQVQDKSNANTLAKLLVFWQALWMIVQVIGRAAEKLPVTLLELHTVLHAFCAVAMYITWWAKPVDINYPTLVTGLTPDQLHDLRHGVEDSNPTNPFAGPNGDDPIDKSYLTSRAGLGKLMYQNLAGEQNVLLHYFDVMTTAYTTLWSSRKRIWREGLSISLVGLTYGGVHLAAWNNTFPTTAEKILWQVAALVTAIAWSTFVLSLWLSVFVSRQSKGLGRICGIVFGIGVFPCLAVRAYLLVEAFLALRKLPVGSYQITKWANAWPHAS